MTPPIPDPAAGRRTELAELQESARRRLRDAMRVVDADPDEAMAIAYGFLLDAAEACSRAYSPYEIAAIAAGVEQARAEHTATLSIGRATTARIRDLQRRHGKVAHG